MSEKIKTNVLIIGSGAAGYTAAIYAARANLKPHLVTGLEPGGQLTITTDVENYPGFGDVIQGPWLMEQMREQALKVGTEIHNDFVTNVDFNSSPFTATTDSGLIFKSKTTIISTGAKARWLEIESEEKFKGYGISACATCDGFFFKDQDVAVIGGGNSAVEEALFLTNFASKVTLIHRRDQLRAEKILQDRLFKNPKVEIIWNKTVKNFQGNTDTPALEKILLKSTTDNSESEIKVSGAFIAIGHDPATSLFLNKIKMDKENYIITKPDSTSTSIPGVFAAGDVKDKIYRQAVTAAGMGCIAALEAEKFLAENS
ncbi:MAG: thioredoxin-disulfide reductase [Candidatus Pelagibacter sp.]|jgi:thioredoxin reductase (NADPH)|uniref:FAD/NAD(P)-binding domain-containing protein n=1 Tax=marine metagenome TaxID=408172 RepID=A0A381T9V7_9ZZZZ|nr:thioredoxin-disulfide reductase [Candidatus Pelagibacter sp.]MCH2542088.1 thioredoxin-disulfide reductase [Alphaproteobacteria bacterium]MEC7745327.1 thioredoxin-disulfide reductase [Pseudomonadota bacterium]HIA61268.1 thioredoxin-disulfide reductase [Pelagibacterales bacterium]|tara:strand:- start:1550 stop:2494 length:945 start_codon:yes stop_codon:yes gene_type:complete